MKCILEWILPEHLKIVKPGHLKYNDCNLLNLVHRGSCLCYLKRKRLMHFWLLGVGLGLMAGGNYDT